MKSKFLTNSFAAAGLMSLAATGAYAADASCNTSHTLEPYNYRNVERVITDNPEYANELISNIARGTVDYAFDKRMAGNAFLKDAKRQLTHMTDRLQTAGPKERARIHEKAYELRLTLERRNFQYHYAMAAQTVAMAAKVGSPEAVLESTVDALNSTTVYDLERVKKSDIRKPSHELAQMARAEGLCSGRSFSNDYLLLRDLGALRSDRKDAAIISKAVNQLKP